MQDARPVCRDRAAERRKGVNADFDAIPEDLANILQGGQVGAALAGTANALWRSEFLCCWRQLQHSLI